MPVSRGTLVVAYNRHCDLPEPAAPRWASVSTPATAWGVPLSPANAKPATPPQEACDIVDPYIKTFEHASGHEHGAFLFCARHAHRDGLATGVVGCRRTRYSGLIVDPGLHLDI